MELIEKYLRERIKQLNDADKAFCEKRWDMTQPQQIRAIYREQSNCVTLARQELESCLQALGLPRFGIEEEDMKQGQHEKDLI